MRDETTDKLGIVEFSRTICTVSLDISYARINPSQILIRCVRCEDIYGLPITVRQIAKLETEADRSYIIQRVCPNLKRSLGEMLISALCGQCWDEIHDVEHVPDDDDHDVEDDSDEEINEDVSLKLKQINLEITHTEESLAALIQAYQAS